MRALTLFFMVLTLALPAAAQERPLYNSKHTGGSTLYNGGSSGQPLSLKQITEGRSTTGYSYNRGGTKPYGSASAQPTSGLNPTMADIEAFRARRAAEAADMEKRSQAALLQGHNGPLSPNSSANAGGALYPAMATGASTAAGQNPAAATGQQPVKTIQRYDGRDTGVTMPTKVFNSVR